MTRLTRALVRVQVRSVHDPADGSTEAAAADVVADQMRDWGRGAADMKSGLAAMLHAVRAVQRSGPLPGRMVVAALADEEGLMLGAKHYARTWRDHIPGEIDGASCASRRTARAARRPRARCG